MGNILVIQNYHYITQNIEITNYKILHDNPVKGHCKPINTTKYNDSF
jgi:hypothetical protein